MWCSICNVLSVGICLPFGPGVLSRVVSPKRETARGEELLLQRAVQNNFTWCSTKWYCGCRQLPGAAAIWREHHGDPHLCVLGGEGFSCCALSYRGLRRVRSPLPEPLTLLVLHVSCQGVKTKCSCAQACSVLGLNPACSTEFESRVGCGLCENSVWLRSAMVAGRFLRQDHLCSEGASVRRTLAQKHTGAARCFRSVAAWPWRSSECAQACELRGVGGFQVALTTL